MIGHHGSQPLASALEALERARKDNRRRQLDIWEAIYQAYLVGFGALAVMIMASSLLPTDPVSSTTVDWLADRGGPLIGLLIAGAATVGLRSGARGGPLAFDLPTVHHVLQAPLDRRHVTQRAAIKQLRAAALWGALAGGATGLTIGPVLPGSLATSVSSFAATGAAAAIALVGCALVASGRRWSLRHATVLGLGLVAWTVVDLAASTRWAPSSLIGATAWWEITRPAVGPAVASFAATAIIAGLGVAVCSGVSVEASRRRAQLVSLIRFALTMQDLRTVVLLRRRMNGSGTRREPWIRVGRTTGTRLPYLRRALQSHIRMPAASLVSQVILTVAAGVSFGASSRGPAMLAMLPALLLLVAAYRWLEPLAQEADHPLRWASHPAPVGSVVTGLTASGLVFMVPIGVLAAGVAAPLWSGKISIMALASLPLAAIGATFGAAIGIMMSDVSKLNPMQSEVFGLYVALRVVLPLLPSVLALAPVTAALATLQGEGTMALSSGLYTAFTAAATWLWLSRRRPERA